MHLLSLGQKVKQGVQKAGLIGYQFNTIGVRYIVTLQVDSSDGISMGTSGMRYSLQSREIIADSIETVTQGLWYDANISLVHNSFNPTNSSLVVTKTWFVPEYQLI